MLNSLRNFSKTKFAGVLVAIIVVPFVFWGMGSVFSGGNTNNVAKINNKNISTEDFIKFINNSNINPNDLKNNLDDKLLQDILSQLISINLLESEVKDIGVILTDNTLLAKLTNEKRFADKENKFSRIKYEKFLLENNISASEFEQNIKKGEMQKDLFQYISGGIKSPDFLIKNFFLEETKEIEIEYLNLENLYKTEFSAQEIKDYVDKNQDDLKTDFIDVVYSKIKPDIITNDEEYNSEFFKVIDEIENDIINGENIEYISSKYKINLKKRNNYVKNISDEDFLKQIYDLRNENKTQLIDKEDYYLLFEIKNKSRILPNINDKNFIDLVINKLKSKEKFNYNKNILKEIETGNYNDNKFYQISKDKNEYKTVNIKSKNDNSFFNVDSLNLLYTIPKNDYLLIVDNNQNIYLTRINSFKYKNISTKDENFNKYLRKSNFSIRNSISTTYDEIINDKYNIVINYNTLDRLKNFFK